MKAHSIALLLSGMLAALSCQSSILPSKEKDLYDATSFKEHADMRKLLRSGANPNYVNDGAPILEVAIDGEDYDGISILLESGANPRRLSRHHQALLFRPKMYSRLSPPARAILGSRWVGGAATRP